MITKRLKLRLKQKQLSKSKLLCKQASFLKKIAVGWEPVDLENDNYMQILTEAMAYNSQVQINYKGSGWRSILPYGWHSSKDGNLLLMCYKDTGEIRSYRMDKIYDLLITNDLFDVSKIDDDEVVFEDFQIPTLPNLDEIIEETENEVAEEEITPYEDGIFALMTGEVPVEFQEDGDIRDNTGNNFNENMSENLIDNSSGESSIDEEIDNLIDDEDDSTDLSLDENMEGETVDHLDSFVDEDQSDEVKIYSDEDEEDDEESNKNSDKDKK